MTTNEHDTADDFPELDSALVERITSIDDAEAAQRADALRAGLADYDLDDEDLGILDAATEDPDAIVYLPALPVLAIVGRPNVGKSALVNRIIGRREAVVEDTPGVTRDRIYGESDWNGRKFRLVDTGGIEPNTYNQILAFMREQAQIAIDNATVIVLVTDIKTGMTAADLGAAPGGWTWILTRHHLRVTSVDNGPLRQNVMDSGLVEHLRADGFQWKPSQSLDWMVCDMVEQPRRVAERMATWLREGWCRHTIFNLKLPMKKRWQETQLCLDLFAQQSEKPLTIRAKQLYHDREEITVFATVNKKA